MKTEDKKYIKKKPYTLSELAIIYGVHRHTFRKWLKPFREEIGRMNGYLFTIPQVEIIFDKLSLPSAYLIENDEVESLQEKIQREKKQLNPRDFV